MHVPSWSISKLIQQPLFSPEYWYIIKIDYFRRSCLAHLNLKDSVWKFTSLALQSPHFKSLYIGHILKIVLSVYCTICFVWIIFLPNPVVCAFSISHNNKSCLITSFGVWIMLIFVLLSFSLSDLLENMVTIFTLLKIKWELFSYKAQQ